MSEKHLPTTQLDCGMKRHHGFTLVELIIAMAVFSFILLFAVQAFIQINKIYVKGITLKRMNDQASLVLSDLKRDIQQGSAPPTVTNSGLNRALNITGLQGVTYTWQDGGQSGMTRQIGPSSQQIVDGNTSVQALDVTSIGGSAVKIDLVLSTQNQNQLEEKTAGDPLTTTCKPSISDQYCGVVYLSTVVRLNN